MCLGKIIEENDIWSLREGNKQIKPPSPKPGVSLAEKSIPLNLDPHVFSWCLPAAHSETNPANESWSVYCLIASNIFSW